MKVMVTGAGGKLGRAVCAGLLEIQGLALRMLLLPGEKPPENMSTEIVEGDLLDEARIGDAVRGMDVVLHLAAMTHSHNWAQYRRVNVDGTVFLLNQCRHSGVGKIVFASSRAAIKGGGAYAESKLEAEAAVAGSGLQYITLAYAEVYGGDRRDAIGKIFSAVERGGLVPIPSDKRCLLAPVFIDDAVAATTAAFAPGAVWNRRYTISGPAEIGYSEMLQVMEHVVGKKARKVSIPLGLLGLLAIACRMVGSNVVVGDQIPRLIAQKSCDISVARRDLSFSPRPFEEGLREFVRRERAAA